MASGGAFRLDTHPFTMQRKAPPVDPFMGENAEIRFEDQLPSLERAAEWNGWEHSEILLELTGHLCGWPLQESNLLASNEQSTSLAAVEALQQ